jgi:hypothetical protein
MLQYQHNISPIVEVAEGPRGFPVVELKHSSGAKAVVHPQSGKVISWKDLNGNELLYMPKDNDFHPNRAIRCALRGSQSCRVIVASCCRRNASVRAVRGDSAGVSHVIA